MPENLRVGGAGRHGHRGGDHRRDARTAGRSSTPTRPPGGSASSTSADPSSPQPPARSTWTASRRASPRSASSRSSRSTRARTRTATARSTSSTPRAATSSSCDVDDRAGSLRRIALAGQPDSIAVSPDERCAAIVIENERDEDDERRPHPAGARPARCRCSTSRTLSRADGRACARSTLTGLADSRPTTRSPSTSTSTAATRRSSSLQENNHLAVVDLRDAKVIATSRPARSTLHERRRDRGGARPAGRRAHQPRRRRSCAGASPTRSQWIDDDTFATANEGDYDDADGVEGGSRGFTLFRKDGVVEYESGASFEHDDRARRPLPARPARRTRASSPRASRSRRSAGARCCSSAPSARTSSASTTSASGTPKLLQILPTGIGPEGLHGIEGRGLLAVSSETDGKADGLRRPLAHHALRLAGGAAGRTRTSRAPTRRRAADPVGRDVRSRRRSDRARHAVGGERLGLAQAYIYEIDVYAHPARDRAADPGRRCRRRRPAHRRLRPRGHRRAARGRLLARERGPHERGQLAAEPPRAHGRGGHGPRERPAARRRSSPARRAAASRASRSPAPRPPATRPCGS